MRFISQQEYDSTRYRRVLEDDMAIGTPYAFRGMLEWSRHGDALETATEITYIEPASRRLGRLSLELSLLHLGNPNEAIITFEATAQDGIITPVASRRIMMAEFGHIGAVSEGYISTLEPLPADRRCWVPRTLEGQAPLVSLHEER